MIAVAMIAGVMVTVGVTPAIAVTGIGASNAIGLFENLPSDLAIAPLDQRTEIYAKSGGKNVLIASFFTQDREVVPWTSIPQTVTDATVAGEDARFYDHGGVDPAGILRATVADLLGTGGTQGASTITQQYVKNVCVQEAERLSTDAEVEAAYAACTDTTASRKLREARYAIALEKRYTKNEILLGYLNIAGFGGRIYGIQSAARYYFGIDAADLSAAQAASLIAIVNDPESLRLDEPKNIAANTLRRNYILKNEYQEKQLTRAEYEAAVASKTVTKITPTQAGCQTAGAAGFFCDYVVNTVLNSPAFGSTKSVRLANLQTAGWKIYTTLDLDIEKKAQSVMNTYVPKKSSDVDVGSAAVSVEVGTGRIISMVQNKIYNNDGNAASLGAQYTALNYSTDEAYGGSSGFQPGSTYKLFTLLDWLKAGHALNDTVDADARTIPASQFQRCGSADDDDADWSVANDDAGEGGYTSVTDATAQSINGAFATMATQLDLCTIRSTRHRVRCAPRDRRPAVRRAPVGDRRGQHGVAAHDGGGLRRHGERGGDLHRGRDRLGRQADGASSPSPVRRARSRSRSRSPSRRTTPSARSSRAAPPPPTTPPTASTRSARPAPPTATRTRG